MAFEQFRWKARRRTLVRRTSARQDGGTHSPRLKRFELDFKPFALESIVPNAQAE